MRRVWTLLCVLCACAAVKEPALVRRALTEPARYTLLTTLLVNGAERRDRDVGYRIKADLHVSPVPNDSKDLFLRLQLVGTELLVRGVHRSAEWEPRASLWDSAGSAPWLVRLDAAGAVKAVLLPVADTADVNNYKRAVTSLFQFEADTALDAGAVERNETDISGECDVIYEKAPNGARKIKRACIQDARAGVNARRITRYTLAVDKTLAELHAEEVVTLEKAVKLRSWHALAYIDSKPNSKPLDLGHLQETDLTLEAPPTGDEDEEKPADLSEAIEQYAGTVGDEEAGSGGDVSAARALLGLLPSVVLSDQATLDKALQASEDNPARLAGLCRALGQAGTLPAARVATSFLRLDAKEPLISLSYHYLTGVALAHAPHVDALTHVLKLAERAKHESIQDAALMALAAAASKTTESISIRDALLRSLKKCKSDSCRISRLLALGNVRAAAADVLVSSAQHSTPSVASAALSALRYVTDLESSHLRRIGQLVTNTSLPLEVRAAALELVIQKRAASDHAAAPLQVLELATALHEERGATAHELRRVLWQRLDALNDAPPIRALVPLLPRNLKTWDARASAGTSHVLRRSLGWAGGAGGWRAALDSVQVARGGVLRRGAVALLARTPEGNQHNELEVDVWTRGLHALAGSGEGEDSDEEMAGGLALSVGGARLPDVTLFSGQAELLGHVWSGTGSSPTGVIRTVRAARWSGGVLPLLAGTWARTSVRGVSALALDAHATVSLWQRTARAGLLLRGAVLAQASSHVVVPWAKVRVRRELAAEPRLRIAMDLDFYSGVALCVRAVEPDHSVIEHLRLGGLMGARHMNVTRGARWEKTVPGHTLALGRANDVACRTLRAADDEE